MLIFLHGPDVYHRQKKLKEIIGQYQKKNSALTMKSFDLEEDGDWLKLKDFLAAGSLFGDKKMAVIENCLALPEKPAFAEASSFAKATLDKSAGLPAEASAKAGKQELSSFYKSFSGNKNSILILISGEERVVKEFLFLQKEPVIFQEFKILIGAGWKKFVDQEIKKRGLVLTPDIRSPTFDLEGDCFGLINELEKLSLGNYELGIRNYGSSYDFFSSIQKLANGGLSQKLPSLELLLENEDSAKIFNLLSAFSKNQKSVFADYDVSVKSGKLEYEEILLDSILRFC